MLWVIPRRQTFLVTVVILSQIFLGKLHVFLGASKMNTGWYVCSEQPYWEMHIYSYIIRIFIGSWKQKLTFFQFCTGFTHTFVHVQSYIYFTHKNTRTDSQQTLNVDSTLIYVEMTLRRRSTWYPRWFNVNLSTLTHW